MLVPWFFQALEGSICRRTEKIKNKANTQERGSREEGDGPDGF